MAKYLVIVESPAKVKTIKKFLGAKYEVMASNGHVRDLPKSQFGIDVDHDYEPKYITIRGKGDILAGLRKEAKKADKVYLATDPDREGEAISWHLSKALGSGQTKRCTGLRSMRLRRPQSEASIKNAREIDMDLVDAQQARRMVDRMVGYRISPILWAKVKRGLSAGRVQSVALRIIADREEEINAFVPEEYWSLDAQFQVKGERKSLWLPSFTERLRRKWTSIPRQEMDQVLDSSQRCGFPCDRCKERGAHQEGSASVYHQYSAAGGIQGFELFHIQKTMRLAQQLYEGVDIRGTGNGRYYHLSAYGFHPYVRGGITRMATEYISQNIWRRVPAAGEKLRRVLDKKIQDAHEAIRPTDITRLPAAIKDSLIQRPVPSVSADLETVYWPAAWQTAVYETPWQ